MAITFLHTADWQLGKPYARVLDENNRNRLQDERFECLKRIATVVRDTQAAFVLVAGDLFDSPSPRKSTVAKACETIGQMQVPVIVIPGNHDHGGPGSLWEQPFFVSQQQQLAPNLKVLLTPEPLVLGQAVILPGPLLRRQDNADPTAWIRSAFEGPAFPLHLPRIVLTHGSIQGFESNQDDEDEDANGLNRIDLARLPDPEIDYIALGDWHGTKQVGPKAWYSGTPEIDRFPKGAQNDPGNLLVVTASRGEVPQVLKVTTGRFRWNEFNYRFTADDGFDAFRTALTERIGDWGQDSLLKLSIDGILGIETSRQLNELIEGLQARLLRLKLEDRVAVAPTDEEIQALAHRPADPLVAAVAAKLIAMSTGPDAATANLALRHLHTALR